MTYSIIVIADALETIDNDYLLVMGILFTISSVIVTGLIGIVYAVLKYVRWNTEQAFEQQRMLQNL